MQNNFFFLSKLHYKSNYMAIDQNKINSILATTDNYKFSHKHTGNLLIKTHNMTHLSDFPNFFQIQIECHYASIDQYIPRERL